MAGDVIRLHDPAAAEIAKTGAVAAYLRRQAAQGKIDPAKLQQAGPPPVPEPPPGVLADFVRWAESGTDAPRASLLTAGIIAASTAVGRGVSMPYGHGRLHANLWAMILANSTSARKTTTLGTARTAITAAVPEANITADRLSPEVLLELLAEQPQQLLLWPEAATVLAAARKQYMADLPAVLTDLYDVPALRIKQRKDPKTGKIKTFRLERPYITILAASTVDWFTRWLEEADSNSGWLPRFLWVVGDRDKPEDPLPAVVGQVPSALAQRLNAMSRLSVTLRFDKQSASYPVYEAAFRRLSELQQAGGTRLDPYYGRLKTVVLKLGMILEADRMAGGQASDGSISPEAMEAAARLTEWYAGNIQWLMEYRLGFSQYEKQMQQVRELLRQAGGAMERRQVAKRLHLYSREFDELEKTLLEQGIIVGQERLSVSGREVAMWVLADVLASQNEE